ncbi:MAG: hypothetical protein AB1646_03405 [Thermodesulfobacteriota bacterium]
MSEHIEVSIDGQGCITIPPEMQGRLGLSPGMTLVVEAGEQREICLRVRKELPELVEKGGVLVVRADAVGDLTDVVGNERRRRGGELVERAGQ